MTNVTIRWMIRRDLDEVLTISREAYRDSWTKEEFLACLRERENIGNVIEDDAHNIIGNVIEDDAHNIIGYQIYGLAKGGIRILNIAVAQDCRRHGVGSEMIDRLKDKLSPGRRTELHVDVDHENSDAIQFFAASGMKLWRVYRDTPSAGRSVYGFRYQVGGNR